MSIDLLLARYGLLAILIGAGIEGETVVIAGGLLAHRGLVPFWGAAAAATLGSFLADQAWFAAGRHFRGYAFVRRTAQRPAFARALAALESHPTAFILAFRFLYGLRTVSPIAIGTTSIPTRRFVPLNALAAIVWGVAFTAIGYVFGRGLTRVFGRLASSHALLALLAIAVVVGLALLGWRHARR